LKGKTRKSDLLELINDFKNKKLEIFTIEEVNEEANEKIQIIKINNDMKELK
tara:strand:+ start:290 stop:445 length:156 start_codon:yes stop_codon:yes gene_type:complete